MAIAPNGTAPYAPRKTVTDIIGTYREHEMRKPFDLDVLMQAGVPESLAPRTLQALKLLDIIDDAGMPTPQFEALVRAPEQEFRQGLADLFSSAYRDVLNFADPATHDLARIRDAFRPYSPRGQQERMVTLFLGLLEYAGLDVSAAAKSSKPKKERPTPKKTPTSRDKQKQKLNGRRRNNQNGVHETPATPGSRPTFGLPDEDLALLTDAEFDEVWQALGKVARARARAASKPPATQESSDKTKGET